MFGELFKGSEILSWPLLSLLLFVAVFVAVLVHVARRRPEQDHHIAMLPLAEEENRHE